jgi:hypothetical protein
MAFLVQLQYGINHFMIIASLDAPSEMAEWCSNEASRARGRRSTDWSETACRQVAFFGMG